MKLAFILSTISVSLLGVTNGYVVKAYDNVHCDGEPETYDFPSNGERFAIAPSKGVKYQSDIDCVLSTYDVEAENKAVTRKERGCFSPGYTIHYTVCY
ncbi:hypothetical protein IMZ48_49580 [Candidatus Bathyarchaeota archaeon]|nr:hypothetical protein [Candidatus Bathyarchaeota archaeon]